MIAAAFWFLVLAAAGFLLTLGLALRAARAVQDGLTPAAARAVVRCALGIVVARQAYIACLAFAIVCGAWGLLRAAA